MPRPRLAVGTRVVAKYGRRNPETGNEWNGTVLRDDDPRAWEGTIAFPGARPTQAEVRRHLKEIAPMMRRTYGEQAGRRGLRDEPTVPVAWDFGKIYFEKIDGLAPAGKSANRAEPDPRVYLSFNTMQVGLRYRVIDQGMPISNDKETAEEALEAAQQFKLKVSDRMWDGDRGEWTARLGRAGSNRAKTLDLVSTRPADLGKDDAGNRYQVVYVGTPRPMANKWDPVWYTTRNGDAIRGPVDRPSAVSGAVKETGETDPMSRAAYTYGLPGAGGNRARGSSHGNTLSAPTRVATLAQLGHAYDSSLFYSVKAGKIYARERTGGGGYGRGRLSKAKLLGAIPGFKKNLFYSVKGGVISARRRK